MPLPISSPSDDAGTGVQTACGSRRRYPAISASLRVSLARRRLALVASRGGRGQCLPEAAGSSSSPSVAPGAATGLSALSLSPTRLADAPERT